MTQQKTGITRQVKNKIDVKLCERFRSIRKKAGLTQPEFAEEIGTTRVAVNAIENGRYNPGIELLRMLRAKYRVTYDYLIDGKE
jgi:transcriptional regulator with XRE-family HTH domain